MLHKKDWQERPGESLSCLKCLLFERWSPSRFRALPRVSGRGQMTIVSKLAFVSLCEHHLLPFFGQIHIGCIARERGCDAAYCARVVESFAHRPQLQERLTEQIADALMEALEPEGIGVAAEGRHMCMMMRGVEKQNSKIQSSTLRGCFFDFHDLANVF